DNSSASLDGCRIRPSDRSQDFLLVALVVFVALVALRAPGALRAGFLAGPAADRARRCSCACFRVSPAGSDSFGGEALVVPSVPTTRGRVSRVRASSRVTVSGVIALNRLARFGFFFEPSSCSPSWTYEP